MQNASRDSEGPNLNTFQLNPCWTNSIKPSSKAKQKLKISHYSNNLLECFSSCSSFEELHNPIRPPRFALLSLIPFAKTCSLQPVLKTPTSTSWADSILLCVVWVAGLVPNRWSLLPAGRQQAECRPETNTCSSFRGFPKPLPCIPPSPDSLVTLI